MNPINLQVSYIDGTTEDVSCIAADLIEFEEKFDLSVARLEKEVKFTHLAFLAYAALQRTGKKSEEFKPWTQRIAGVSEVAVKK
jgi:predicted NACHT family NTPase